MYNKQGGYKISKVNDRQKDVELPAPHSSQETHQYDTGTTSM